MDDRHYQEDGRRTSIVVQPNAVDWLWAQSPHNENEPKLDVILLLLSSPTRLVVVDDEENNRGTNLAHALFHALADDGIVGGQVHHRHHTSNGLRLGSSSSSSPYDPKDTLPMIHQLQTAGFFSFREYAETISTPKRRRSTSREDYFWVATKDRYTLSNWFASEAWMDLELARRQQGQGQRRRELPHQTKPDEQHDSTSPSEDDDNESFAFQFMDGATMALYQTPPRSLEKAYCALAAQQDNGNYNDYDNKPFSCDLFGLDPDIPNLPASAFELRPATNPQSGRGVFAKYDIPPNVYMGADDGVHAMLIMPKTTALIRTLVREREDDDDGNDVLGFPHPPAALSDYFDTLFAYADGYGMESFHYGEPAVIVDPGIFTFLNHGCNGTYHTAERLPVTELSARTDRFPPDFRRVFYNPNLQRHHWVDQGCTSILAQYVPANAEVLDNYLYLSQGVSEREWASRVLELRLLCQGITTGLVSNYETHGSSRNSNKVLLSEEGMAGSGS
ncbi:hypothetical protein ACA910_005210 [Epithemia clementina (nom. ined.)]